MLKVMLPDGRTVQVNPQTITDGFYTCSGFGSGSEKENTMSQKAQMPGGTWLDVDAKTANDILEQVWKEVQRRNGSTSITPFTPNSAKVVDSSGYVLPGNSPAPAVSQVVATGPYGGGYGC